MRSAPLALLVPVLATLAACGGTSAPVGGATTTTGTHPPALHLGASADRKTLDVAVGQEVDVALEGVQWTIAPPTPATSLRALAGPSAVATHCTPVGSGCGTTSERFTAVAAGTTVLTAHRDSCGEALACTGRRGEWTVTLVTR